MQYNPSSNQTPSPADATAVAYARWVRVHQSLTEAEQQLALLPTDAENAVRAVTQARVDALREESEALLQAAQARLRARDG